MRCLLPLLLLVSMSSPVASQVNDWSRGYGDSGNQITHRVCVDGSRNIFVTGDFEGQGDFGGGILTSAGVDVFILKLDPEGNHLWSRVFGDETMQRGYRAAADAAGNVVLVGNSWGVVDFGNGAVTSTTGGMFMAKFDPNGDLLWAHGFGDSQTHPFDVDIDGADNIVTIGSFTDSITLGGAQLVSAGADDIFLGAFDANGSHLWSRRFGSSGSDHGVRVDIDRAQRILASGRFTGTVDFGSGPIVAPVRHVFVAKFETDGTNSWSRGFGDPESPLQSVQDIDTDADGNVILTGWLYDTIDFGGGPISATSGQDLYLTKLSPSGSHIWSHGFGADGDQFPGGVAIDAVGDALLVGYSSGTVDFGSGELRAQGTDVFVARFTADGVNLGSQEFGDADDQYAEGIALDNRNEFVIGGFFQGAIDFGTGALVSVDGLDGFVAKFGDVPVPVRIVDFQACANVDDQAIHLTWRLQNSPDAAHLKVQRSLNAAGPYEDLQPALSPAASMAFSDGAVMPGSQYFYRLLLVDRYGHRAIGPTLGTTLPEGKERTTLVVDYAGGAAAIIRYRVPSHNAPATIRVYDVLGRQVRDLGGYSRTSAVAETDWNLRDDVGGAVASGVYLVRLVGPTSGSTAKVVLVRR